MPVTTVVVCCSSSVTISYAWRTSCARNISLKNKSEVLSLIWEADEAGARLCVYVGVRVRVCVVDVSHKTRKKKNATIASRKTILYPDICAREYARMHLPRRRRKLACWVGNKDVQMTHH
jgi:hypothetical protein